MPAGAAEAEAPLGILAGGSGLPIEIAEAVIGRGRGVHIVGLRGEAEPGISRFPHTWVEWGGVGAILTAFRAAGCRDIVIVGRVRRPNLTRIRPDLGFWRALPSVLSSLRGGDDAILRMVVGFFESHGLVVRGAHQAAPELIAPSGTIGTRQPGSAEREAIGVGVRALADLGPFNSSQAVVVDADGLIAAEGADGTDAMLRRLAACRDTAPRHDRSGRPTSGGVLVKLPKAGQERRIDLPAIGPETIRRAAAAGLSGIAVASGETLVAERREVERLAAEAGLFVFGIAPAAGVTSPVPGNDDMSGIAGLTVLTRAKPSVASRADAALGARVAAALEPHWASTTVTVSRGYVLAIDGPGEAMAAAGRAGALKPWGARLLRGRVGVLVLGDVAEALQPEAGRLIDRAKASGLAGIAVLRVPLDDRAMAGLALAADAAGLFVLAPGSALQR